ncbi:hypothetical protein [Wenjunlia tyrosinilytica]|uniref:CHRD domain-containing protein n=1 Tax=Wenjunlia tyrosinilytica TaxID=1544741 RepID=A0A918DXL6_9ACTN|nr:hypothetical protein [Wenjunlia tyrosinilytica]GGO87119.1 hypothetical protein GCM10012280_24870 [Wenjunlia tyrosinilytica]
MKAKRTARFAVLAALPTIFALAAAAPASAAPGSAFQINLESLNNSGATGTVMLGVNGTQLTVKIEADGLTPGAPHAQHLHGSTEGHNFHCPDASADADGDGIVTTTEAVPMYGDINISLTTEGDTSAKSGLAVDRMPNADSTGHLSYERTIAVSQDVADHIQDLHIVQHGIDPNKNGKYDFGKGKSELDPKLPQEATAPTDCGEVEGASVGAMPAGGVETGSGSTAGIESPAMFGVGGVTLAGAAGAWFLARRREQGQEG